ncbi:MAG: class I SAM-dependent methyltransferase [Candidatus Electrothrix sp. YB6]
MKNLLIQYGCGLSAPEDWLNFDASPTLRLQKLPFIEKLTRHRVRFPAHIRYGDIVHGLPVADCSAHAVYCSHVLEHLSLEDFEQALANTYNILQPEGIFRLVVPDLSNLAESYRQDTSALAAVRFMRNSGMGRERRSRGIIGFLSEWLGNSRHLWLWDYPALRTYLEQASFVMIRRAEYGDSLLPEFASVEDQERWQGAVGVECRRPAE